MAQVGNENFLESMWNNLKSYFTTEKETQTSNNIPKSRKKPNSIFCEYNKAGQLIKKSEDCNRDGKIDYIETFEYNEAGKLIKETQDSNGDGKPDNITEYNKTGKCTKYTEVDADGKPEYIQIFKYNEVTHQEKHFTDENADGEIDRIEIYEHDENGNILKVTFDNNADGKPDKIQVFESGYDSLIEEIIYDSNGKPIRVYSADG